MKTLIMMLMLMFCLPCISQEVDTMKLFGPYKPDEQGFIKDWLVAGPFPNPGKRPVSKGYFTDYLQEYGGELNIMPRPRMRFTARFDPKEMDIIGDFVGFEERKTWKLDSVLNLEFDWKPCHWEKSFLNLLDQKATDFPVKEYAICYAACYVQSDKDQNVKVKLGSDDGYKLWINHEFIGESFMVRGTKPDDNIHNVKLKSGMNVVLLKIEQDWGGWSFTLRFTNEADKPLTDVGVFLNLPEWSAIAETSEPKYVNIVDNGLVGWLLLDGHSGETTFPGSHKAMLSVSSNQEVDGQIITILRTKGKELEKNSRECKTGPDKRQDVNFEIAIPEPGAYDLEVFLEDNKKGLIGKATRKIFSGDPVAVEKKLRNVESEINDLKKEMQIKDDRIENMKFIIKSKEALIEKMDKRIGEAFEKINELNIKGKDQEGK